ncbi:CHAD domain-containing protein [Novosphingobium bradum]|uniref:CHAD domain-containing protein n=1 Tax=Novosphingobium bradum TaxID=1737444 RepID=A0ABV7IT92_9SPHN
MGSEVELKLDLTAEAADRLAESGVLGAGEVRQLRSLYFDTPDDRLRRHGLALRIRRDGHRLVQTVKQRHAPGAGLFARGEWEFAVRSLTPVVDSRGPLEEALGRHAGDLAIRFTVDCERTRFTLAEGRTTIAAVLDRGQVHARDRATGFAELELELVSGAADDLFALARRLDQVAPLRIGVLSKSDRGFRLVGALPGSEKAAPVALTPATGVVGACAAIVTGCLHHYRRNEAILLATRDGEALHQARVALRRLRSAHAVFAPLLRDGESARLDSAVRGLARVLGAARDLDVLWERCAPDLRPALKPRREVAWRGVSRALAAPATRRLMLDLAQWAMLGGWRDAPLTAELRAAPLAPFAAAALDKRLERVRRHGHHLADLPDEARHTLRKDAKKLRYAVEFFAGLPAPAASRKRRDRFLAALAELQDRLGLLNDLAVARAVLGAAAPDDEAQARHLLHRASEARHALLGCDPFW